MRLVFIRSQTQTRLSKHDPDLTQLQAFELEAEKDRRADDRLDMKIKRTMCTLQSSRASVTL